MANYIPNPPYGIRAEIPITHFGKYQIANSNFFINNIREYELLPNSISPLLTQSYILYGIKKVNINETIFLNIELYDELGIRIPN